MKKLMLVGIIGIFFMSACANVGLNIGTSIIPGVYIGTSVPLTKANNSKEKSTETNKEVDKSEITEQNHEEK